MAEMNTLTRLQLLGTTANLPRLRSTHGRRICPAQSSQVNNIHTNANLIAAEAPFEAVRLIYYNHNTGGTCVIQRAAVNVTSAPNDGWSLTNGYPNWVPVTFNGAVSATVPAAPSGDTPSFVVSDWIAISSIPRSDGATLPLINVRSYVPGNQQTPSWTGAVGYQSNDRGRMWKSVYQLNDGVTNPAANDGTTASSRALPAAIQFRYRHRGVAMLGIGDSIVAGDGSTGGNTGWGHLTAARLSKLTRPVSWINGGTSGMGSIRFNELGRAQIDLHEPDIVLIMAQSGNDGTMSDTTLAASRARALETADYAIRKGAVPVLINAQPRSGATAVEEARQRHNALLRTMASDGGFLVLDIDTPLRDPANPSRQLASLTADQVHMNDAGQAACADAAEILIGNMIYA